MKNLTTLLGCSLLGALTLLSGCTVVEPPAPTTHVSTTETTSMRAPVAPVTTTETQTIQRY